MSYQINGYNPATKHLVQLPQLYLSEELAQADLDTLQQLFPHIIYTIEEV